MGTAAYSKKVKVSTDGSAWSDLPVNTANLNEGGDILDDTEMATNAGYRNRIYGLLDWSVGGTIEWVAGNTAIDMVRDARINRSTLHVQYLPDGTVANGFQGEVRVATFNWSGDVGGKETIQMDLQADGAIAAAT